MKLVGLMTGVLFWTAYPVLPGTLIGDNLTAMAAPAGNTGGQGVSGVPQKNPAVKGSPKANPSIDGSRVRGKH